MGIDLATIFANAGSAGIVGAMFISYLYFDSKKKRQTLVIKDDERADGTKEVATELRQENKAEDERLVRSEVMFTEHCKTQTETLAVIHNGLNTNAHAIDNIRQEMAQFRTDVSTQLATLTTIINERIPKK